VPWLPVDLDQLLPFLLAVALVELTPGPNMAYLSLVSLRNGRRAGLATVAGVTLGLAVYLAAAVAGLAEIAVAQPIVFAVLRWAGVVYLLWLAVQTWRGDEAGPEGAVASPTGRLIARGFLTNLLNPKAAIFYLAILPSFVRPEHGHIVAQSLILGAVHLAVAVGVHLTIVLTAGSAHRFLAHPGGSAAMQMRGAFAAGLVGVAVWVVWSTRVG
jgi:threonine/homoserine/homoserine lactone efflux protein